jgi:aspartyl/asparaginyl beta-hydroxylase (cupin superfamily)
MIPKGSFAYRVLAGAGLVLIRAFEWGIRRHAGERIFYEPQEFRWPLRLEGRWKEIREELDRVLADDGRVPSFESLSEEQARIVQPQRWKTFFFYAYGHRVEENCRRCPMTTEILRSIPGMTTAMFSILTPGTRLTPHRGPFKGVLRYHLGLMVPPGDERCAIRVGGELRTWREGESLVFDDTYEHEAWNETAVPRVVLFVDFLRDLPFPLSTLNRGMIRLIGASPFVQNILENLNRLNGRVADAALPAPS